MNENKFLSTIKALINVVVGLLFLTLVLGSLGFYINYFYEPEIATAEVEASINSNPEPEIVNGIHVATGFKDDQYLDLVITNCTACHSSKLVTQNRATKEGWISMIRWMQETQKLWNLGENEAKIVEYLSKNYAPTKTGRRQPLSNIEWYELD